MNPIKAIDKVEELILTSLSMSDREVLKSIVEKMLADSKREDIKSGYEKILKAFNHNQWDFEETPYSLSVNLFGKNVFSLSNFQYRICIYQDILIKVKKLIGEIKGSLPQDRMLLFSIDKKVNGFENILGDGVNFKGLPNSDSYYETHHQEYEFMRSIHKEFVKQDCQFLRELIEESLK